jgi:hypothetical protein
MRARVISPLRKRRGAASPLLTPSLRRRGKGEVCRVACTLFLLAFLTPAFAQPDGITFASPGLSPSRMGIAGQLLEDWGTVMVRVTAAGPPVMSAGNLEAIKLDGIIPAARFRSQSGSVAYTLTAYRAPAFPAGIDVLTVRLEETAGQEAAVTLSLDLPEGARAGQRTVTYGGRTVMTIPPREVTPEQMRDWGFADEAVALPGWARPEGDCDPAFRNIRAGMGGVPIFYRFRVEPKSAANVLLGLCESHWGQSGQRPLICKVEGAPAQEVDPVAKWGQHKPGALVFRGRDLNGDGWLDITVTTTPSAPDQNPILNVLWLFPPGEPPNPEQVITGRLNGMATRYVDVGGPGDQSLYPPGKLEWKVTLPARGAQEMTFFVACPGGDAPVPTRSAWTEESLRRAAREVWREWRER